MRRVLASALLGAVLAVAAIAAAGGARETDRFGALEFEAPIDPHAPFSPCAAGGLDEFLLERYTAFTKHGDRERLFRACHEPWPQVPIDVTMLDESLLASTGPWFREARRAGANYSPGFETVWMGRPRRRAGW